MAAGAVDQEFCVYKSPRTSFWDAMGLPWVPVGRHWAPFGRPWASFGSLWGALGGPWAPFGVSWGALGLPLVALGGSWGPLWLLSQLSCNWEPRVSRSHTYSDKICDSGTGDGSDRSDRSEVKKCGLEPKVTCAGGQDDSSYTNSLK